MEGEKCGVSDPVPVGYTIYGPTINTNTINTLFVQSTKAIIFQKAQSHISMVLGLVS